jgi:ATP-dependent Clp protease adaptor protein ClpS
MDNKFYITFKAADDENTDNQMAELDEELGVVTIPKRKSPTKQPILYKVYLLNDDYTTMDFVVDILETVFQKSPAEAVAIMLHVHNLGKGLCGAYVKQIAEAKINIVHEKARLAGYPLKCVMEEE